MRWGYVNAAMGIPLQGPSGASAHVRGICSALKKQQELRIFSATRTDHRGVFGLAMEAKTYSNPLAWLKRYRALSEMFIARKIANDIGALDWRPEILLERHSLFSDASWRAGEQLGIPWMLEVNAPILEERYRYEHIRFPKLGRDWQQDVLLACPMIFAVSRWLRDWLVEEIGCQNVHWLPNGTSNVVGNATRGRALIGVNEGQKIIGFVGSFRAWQGVDRIPTMAQKVGALSVCIGHGPSVGADVQMAVYDVQDLADIISTFSVAVAPYTKSAPPWLCPLKLLQYRAQGIPIVSSDVGDAKWIIQNEGSVLPADNDNFFEEAIQYWMNQSVEKSIRSWDEVSREMISHVHDWQKTG